MKYTPTDGKFSGQLGYGYRSIAEFVKAAREIQAGTKTAEDFDTSLATIHTTAQTTAILEAGRLSLDSDSCPVTIVYGADRDAGTEAAELPVAIKLHTFKE